MHIGRGRLGEHPLARVLFDPARAKFYSKDAKIATSDVVGLKSAPRKQSGTRDFGYIEGNGILNKKKLLYIPIIPPASLFFPYYVV